MCDLWRMSLCPCSPVSASHRWRNSASECSPVHTRLSQRAPRAARQLDSPPTRKVIMDGRASIFKGSRDGKSVFPISYCTGFTDSGAFFSRVNFSQFTFVNNGASAVKKHKEFTVTPSHFTSRGNWNLPYAVTILVRRKSICIPVFKITGNTTINLMIHVHQN